MRVSIEYKRCSLRLRCKCEKIFYNTSDLCSEGGLADAAAAVWRSGVFEQKPRPEEDDECVPEAEGTPPEEDGHPGAVPVDLVQPRLLEEGGLGVALLQHPSHQDGHRRVEGVVEDQEDGVEQGHGREVGEEGVGQLAGEQHSLVEREMDHQGQSAEVPVPVD